MTTSNMSLNEPSVGVTAGPTWATETNANWELLDAHDHTSGKGVQLTPSALNINSDMEFNQNSATELKNAVLDNDIHASSSGDTNYSVYSYGANLYWRNGSGTAVQITNGASLNSTGGAITSPTTNSQVLFSSVNNSYTFKYDKTQTDGIAKMIHSDLQLYFYNSGSATTRSVNLKYLGSGTGSNTLTVPDETGTLLSTATSFAGAINIATSSTNYPINLKPNGTGHVVIGNTGATGKLTSNGAYDLVLDTNSGTNSSSITITDAANGNISFTPNGTGEIVIGSGSASGKITSSGAFDLVLDTNAGTNSGTITITDGVNGNIDITPNGSGEVNISKVDIDGGTLGGFTIDGNWTAASQTCADLGSVTTCDINGGTINGITDLAVADGGTGVSSLADGGLVVGDGSGSVEVVAAGAITEILVGGGTNTAPVWTAATGSGNPVRAASPILTTPALGTPSSGTLTNCSGTASGLTAGAVTNGVYTNSDTTLGAGVDLETSTTGKIKQKAAFMQSSTHQALILGY